VFLFFLIVSVGTFLSLLAAEYGAQGRNGTAHFLLSTSTKAANLVVIASAVAGLYLGLSIVLWLLSALSTILE
jgi:hypothetical protein